MRACGVPTLRSVAFALAIAMGGCSQSCNDDAVAVDAARTAAAPQPLGPSIAPAPREPPPIFDLVSNLASCEIRHRGISIDVGTRAANARRGFDAGPFEDVKDVEREGATFGRILDRRVDYDFWLDDPVENVQVSLRLHGVAGRSLVVSLGDRRLGSVKLSRGETRIATFSPIKGELAAGRHTLKLRLSGRPRDSADAYAEIDWIRVGVAEDTDVAYAAPTLRDVVTDVVIDGVPKRSIVLRAPSSVRCPVVLAPDAALRLSLGFWGDGKGEATARLLADGDEPETLLERKVTGGEGATWITLNHELAGHAGKVLALELAAEQATMGGRVVFGDPAVVRAKPGLPRVPEATTVVLVVLSAIDRRRIPPWGSGAGLSTLSMLSKTGVAFASYRAPTTVSAAVVASMLTGLPPRAHALEDPAARLPAAARTLGEIVKAASGRTAFFTGAPTTFSAFGFGEGWDDFEMLSPVQDLPASEPIQRAARWLERELEERHESKRLVVVHARGAHPPWDVPKERVATLPPEEYGGILDARRGGIMLAKVRNRRSRAQRRMDDADWVRLRALERASLIPQDEALGRLVTLLKKKNEWDRSLLIVVGDVAPGEGPEPPYDPAADPDEERLLVPLLVKFPASDLPPKEATSSVTSVDVAATILAALRLDPPPDLAARDLYGAASGVEPLVGRALMANLADHYATVFGRYRLAGELGKVPSLCRLDVDPACVNDVLTQKPIAAQATWQWTFLSENAALDKRIAPREPASIDPDVGAALTVWGDI